MRTQIIPVLTASALIVVAISSPAHASAMITHKVRGVIESVNSLQNRFVFRSTKLPKLLTLTWDKLMQINFDKQRVPTSEITPGREAEVSYRLPTFGHDYATRIVLLPRQQQLSN